MKEKYQQHVIYSDKDLLSIANEALARICEMYPQFTLSGSFSMENSCVTQTNDAGMDYENRDCHIQVSVEYKHKDSINLCDGFFQIGQRDFSFDKLYEMADNYLGAFEKKAELPEETVLQIQYYELVGYVSAHLNAELLSLGTSLLAGKIGQQVFSEDFTLIDDVSDDYCWHTPFWDGGGGFNEKGDYVMPVHHAFLCDGERFLGSLPAFTLSSNMFDRFGKAFIGAGSDQPVFIDKCVLLKVTVSQNA